jgi:hypothetical protein
MVEEYLGNTTKISAEGIVIDNIAPFIDPKINVKNREIDNDYLENSIGDVLSGSVSCALIIMYWKYYGELPYFYLIGIIPIFFMLIKKSSMLYDK